MSSALPLASSDNGTAASEPRPSAAELKAAAVRLMAKHERTLRRTARRFSICADDADDAYQRALVILLTKAPTTRDLDLVRWMQTVTKHEALAVRRQRERLVSQVPASRDNGDFDPVDSLPADTVGPGERAERTERVERSRDALSTLKPHEVKALTLKAQGYSYAEIGSMTGWSYTKINRLMAEGRKRFLEVFRGIEQGHRCDDLAEELEEAASGSLEPGRLRDLRRHIRGCGRCRAALRARRGLPQGVLSWLAPAFLAWRAWASRVQDWFHGPVTTRFQGAGARLHELGELAASQKAVVAVAVTAAAGGGVAIERQVERETATPSAIHRPATSAPSQEKPDSMLPPAGPIQPGGQPQPKAAQAAPPADERSGPSEAFEPDSAGVPLRSGPPEPQAPPGPAQTPRSPGPRVSSGGSEEFGL